MPPLPYELQSFETFIESGYNASDVGLSRMPAYQALYVYKMALFYYRLHRTQETQAEATTPAVDGATT